MNWTTHGVLSSIAVLIMLYLILRNADGFNKVIQASSTGAIGLIGTLQGNEPYAYA